LALAATLAYTYDDAGRLIRADYGGGVSLIYIYDPAGNLLERQVHGGTTEPFTPTLSPQGQGAESPLPQPQRPPHEHR
jgi:YD repeat-containing protein